MHLFYGVCILTGLMQDKNSLEKRFQNSVQRNPEVPRSWINGPGKFTVQLKYKSSNLTRHACMYKRNINPYPTAFPYGNVMVLHFYQQQESSTTKTLHKVINKGLKTYV